jgi:hypothetical protein
LYPVPLAVFDGKRAMLEVEYPHQTIMKFDAGLMGWISVLPAF